MSIRITAVRYSGYQKTHESISELRWVSRETGETGDIAKSALVSWLDSSAANTAFVTDARRTVEVKTVHPTYGAAYARTQADGVPTDNLLALPTF